MTLPNSRSSSIRLKAHTSGRTTEGGRPQNVTKIKARSSSACHCIDFPTQDPCRKGARLLRPREEIRHPLDARRDPSCAVRSHLYEKGRGRAHLIPLPRHVVERRPDPGCLGGIDPPPPRGSLSTAIPPQPGGSRRRIEGELHGDHSGQVPDRDDVVEDRHRRRELRVTVLNRSGVPSSVQSSGTANQTQSNERVSRWWKADAIGICKFPEPILVKVRFAPRFANIPSGTIEEGVA